MLTASTITTGSQLRQFVLALLRERGLSQPVAWHKAPSLDVYLSSVWHVAQQYKDQPFQFYFIAEILEKAFDYPPMPYDWEAELQMPYQPVPDNLAPPRTPEHSAEIDSYSYFERVIKRQIGQLKRTFRLPKLPEFDGPVVLNGHKVYWMNLFVEPFLERGTTGLEEDHEEENDGSWSHLVSILRHGQNIE